MPPVSDPFSPFSTSTDSSGQGGAAKPFHFYMSTLHETLYCVIAVTHQHNNLISAGVFPLQLNLQQGNQTPSQHPPHFSSSPWDMLEFEQTKVVKREYIYILRNSSHECDQWEQYGLCCICTGCGYLNTVCSVCSRSLFGHFALGLQDSVNISKLEKIFIETGDTSFFFSKYLLSKLKLCPVFLLLHAAIDMLALCHVVQQVNPRFVFDNIILLCILPLSHI